MNVAVGESRQGDLGFMLHPDHQGHGYATEAASAMLEFAFGSYDLHRVSASVEPRNAASVRVLERLGMRKEAHLLENDWVKGDWSSEAIYAILAREWRERRGRGQLAFLDRPVMRPNPRGCGRSGRRARSRAGRPGRRGPSSR